MNTKNQFTYILICSIVVTISPYMHAQSITNQKASVRIGTALSKDEKNYVAQRMPRIKKVLESLLATQLTDDQVPRIALCTSGGGYRAALATLGMLQGASQEKKSRSLVTALQILSSSTVQKLLKAAAAYLLAWFAKSDSTVNLPPLLPDTHPISLLDATTYCASLSGSAWAMAGWIQSRKSVEDYSVQITHSIQKNLLRAFDITHVTQALSQKKKAHQPLSLVDIYGVLLADTFLANCGAQNPNNHTLALQQECVATARIPFPIYNAIIGNDDQAYQWVEFNPFEIGCPSTKGNIPTWSFGRTFANGASKDFPKQQSLGYLMGIWGSAMCLNLREFIDLMKPHLDVELQNLFAGTTLEQHLTDLDQALSLTASKGASDMLLDRRLSPARVGNWTYKAQGCELRSASLLTLVDAGIHINLPMPPLLRPERAVDIIIVLDASDATIGKYLTLSQHYARDNNLKFPPIDTAQLASTCSIHKDPQDRDCPIVVYMPLIKNDRYKNGWDPRTASFTTTSNFAYTQEQSELLMGLTEFTMQENMPVILDVIREWIRNRK